MSRYGPTALDDSYKRHPVFQQLEKYSDFYNSLSFSVFGFITLGTTAIFNIDSHLFSSIKGTIDSINLVLASGRIGDAYALLRRYYDSAMINIYSNLYLKNNFNIENLIVKQIQDWLNGNQQMPEFRVISNYIRNSPQLTRINDLLYANPNDYKGIRDRCNNFIHYNIYANVLYNDNRIYLKGRTAVLERLAKDLDYILILHLAYLFYLNDHYMMSSDYVDYLDCGSTPPPDSQYFVGPFVQEIFDSVIKIHRMDIVEEIKKNTAMQLK